MKVKRLHKEANLPLYATDGAGCFDLFTVDSQFIAPGEAMVHGTGLAFAVPKGHVMLIFSRSGMGFKQSGRLSNCVGVIDSDYRGEVMVRIHNDSKYDPIQTQVGDRIAQALVLPVERIEFELVNELDETERGDGGLGSTGA